MRLNADAWGMGTHPTCMNSRIRAGIVLRAKSRCVPFSSVTSQPFDSFRGRHSCGLWIFKQKNKYRNIMAELLDASSALGANKCSLLRIFPPAHLSTVSRTSSSSTVAYPVSQAPPPPPTPSRAKTLHKFSLGALPSKMALLLPAPRTAPAALTEAERLVHFYLSAGVSSCEVSLAGSSQMM